MFLNTGIKKECCGCSACASICPKDCISMKTDFEGFKYPELINKNACINCGLCEKVCPFVKENNKEVRSEPNCYYGWKCDDEKRMASTSGGAFASIAEVSFKLGYTNIYGVAYNSRLVAYHKCINDLSEINLLTQSKYMQSALDNVFNEIREKIRSGEKVVFSGTPCQVQGLLNFIGSKNKNSLLTIALVCHGVGSPLIFRNYLDELEKKNHSSVNKVSFRDKRIIDGKLSHKCTTIGFENGKEISSTEDPYTMAFGMGIVNRESCFNCPFSTTLRNADITIGDFWGIENAKPELEKDISKGISLILTHTENGEELIDELKKSMLIEGIDLSYAVNPRQQQLIKPMSLNPRRASFMKKVTKEGNFIKKVKKELFFYKCRRSISIRLSKFLGLFGR